MNDKFAGATIDEILDILEDAFESGALPDSLRGNTIGNIMIEYQKIQDCRIKEEIHSLKDM